MNALRDRVLFAHARRLAAGESFLPGEGAEEAGLYTRAGLYANLAPGAAARLEAILARLEKIAQPSVASWRDLYTQEEYAAFERYCAFCQDVRKEGGHFCRRGFRLPVRFPLAESLLYQCGAGLLKTRAGINGKAIIDAGAFIGDSALVFHKLFPASTVYAFEPDEANFALLRKTLALNNLPESAGSVVPEKIALGAARGAATLAGESARARIRENGAAGRSVRLETLDHYVAAGKLRVGLIKCDIEGHERQFLAGALKTITTQRPALIISIYHNAGDFFQIKPWLEELDLGYTFDFFKGIDCSVHTDIMLLCEVG